MPTPNYRETVQDKRNQATQLQKERAEAMAMRRELQKMQMASLMGSQGKSTVILTDQTDLGDKMKEHTVKVVEAIKGLERDASDQREIDALKEVEDAVMSLEKEYIEAHRELVAAVKSIKVSPVVNVPALKPPVVNVDAPDLSPLQATMREVFQPKAEKLDLECFRAQDITDDGDIQYVGFLNPEGDWYIIENNVVSNSMRYAFGSGDYSKAFARASTFDYQLLNEAVNATA